MKRTAICTLITALFVVAVAVVLVGGPSSHPDAAIATSARPAADQTTTGLLPEPIEQLISGKADSLGEWPIRLRETDDSEVLYLTRDDFVRSERARQAQLLGYEYAAKDLLAPVRNSDGVVVGYRADGVSRMITPDEANAAGFDVCSIRSNAQAARCR